MIFPKFNENLSFRDLADITSPITGNLPRGLVCVKLSAANTQAKPRGKLSELMGLVMPKFTIGMVTLSSFDKLIYQS